MNQHSPTGVLRSTALVTVGCTDQNDPPVQHAPLLGRPPLKMSQGRVTTAVVQRSKPSYTYKPGHVSSRGHTMYALHTPPQGASSVLHEWAWSLTQARTIGAGS